jgi:pyruvate formate lyase activating enzyme
VDAMNIDVKAFTASFYMEICKATLEDVMQTVEIAAPKCHIELTTLVIPGLNDSMMKSTSLQNGSLQFHRIFPLHLSRYFPNYKMTHIPPTPEHTLLKAREKALEHLNYVYLGNI